MKGVVWEVPLVWILVLVYLVFIVWALSTLPWWGWCTALGTIILAFALGRR